MNKTECAGCDHDQHCTGAAPVLLRIQEVLVGIGNKKAKTLVLFDPGSTATLITHDFAEKLGLIGERITYYLKVVGQGYTRKETQAYKVPLKDRSGKQWELDVLGIEAITSVDGELDLSAVRSQFPKAPPQVFHRPAGAVQLLVGSNYEALQPFDGVLAGGLRLLESHLGVGNVSSGTDPRIKAVGSTMTAEARHMASAVRELPVGAPKFDSFHASLKLPTFQEAEELGTAPARHCKKCRDCKQCLYHGRMITRDEGLVVKMVEDTMWLDEDKKEINVQYPWKPEADQQVNNREQALSIQRKVESKLMKAGRLTEYNLEMQKQIDRGVAQLRDERELQNYEGPLNYVAHFAVFNPESPSTKLRIVSHSALKNSHTGLSINDCMYAGPNQLTDLHEVLLKFRGFEVGLLMDLSKAYQALRTGKKEADLRLFLWRSSPEEEW